MADLKKGSKGKEVKELQTSLNDNLKPKPKLKVDGRLGPITEQAVKDFQTKNKLKVTGIVDQKTMEKLTAGGGASEKPKKVSISYNVPRYAQPTGMSCWATAIAMMLSWKKSMSFNPQTIADELGYTTQFKSSGLHPEDTKAFKHWGLKWDAPMCYSVQGFADLLNGYGPVWLAGNARAPHVRVVVGMNGDGTPDGTKLTLNDPADGKKHVLPFTKVMGTMEGLGASPREMKMKKPIYVAHL